MSLITLAEALDWCEEYQGFFTINAANDTMVFTSSSGGPVTITISDGSYEGAALATALAALMNANNTLTGTGTITFAITYSSSTRLFTIDAGAGHTIAYTNTGSSAGLTLGFNVNHAAARTISSDIPAGDPSIKVQRILNAVDAWAKKVYLLKSVEAADYVEYHDGGRTHIALNEAPIIKIYRVTSGLRNGIELKNTATGLAYATVTVDATAMTLRVVGSAYAGTDTITFASSDTLGSLVTSINALGHGWTAELADPDYTTYPYTELIQTPGLKVTKDSPYYLDIPSDYGSPYTVDQDTGHLYAGVSQIELGYIGNYIDKILTWPYGVRNIRVEYRGGYETVPTGIATGAGMLVRAIYDRDREEGTWTRQWSTAGISKVYDDLPQAVRMGFDAYARKGKRIW